MECEVKEKRRYNQRYVMKEIYYVVASFVKWVVGLNV